MDNEEMKMEILSIVDQMDGIITEEENVFIEYFNECLNELQTYDVYDRVCSLASSIIKDNLLKGDLVKALEYAYKLEIFDNWYLNWINFEE